jgi:RecA-family ATPase
VHGVHHTQLSVIAALLNRGCSLDEAVDTLLEQTRTAVAGEPAAAGWDWEKEELELRRMGASWVNKHPELAHVLPDDLREAFERKLDAGEEPLIVYATHIGWHVRPRPPGRAPKVKVDTDTTDRGAAGDAPGCRGIIEAQPFVRFDPAMLPAREWLYGGHYQSGIITATVGPGGGGKSSLNLVELIAICTGRDLLGEQPHVRCRAWYHNAEDSRNEIYRRIAAVCQHYALDQAELEGWLFVTSGIEMPIKIATARMGSVAIDPRTAAAVIRTIADNEIGITSFDPLVATHRAVENVTGDMDQVVREFARIANATDCSIEIVHHTRKPAHGQEELSVVDSRGAGAIIDAVRSARVLNTMSKSDAEKANIDEVDRRLHFRIDKGKANQSPPTAARWHKFVSVELPNGDDVGVATHWTYPGQGSPMAAEANKDADNVFLQLLVRLTMQGRKVSSSPGANYAPNVFSKEREAKAAKIGKSALGDAMRRLFDEGRIQVEHDGAGSHRSSRIVVAIP